MPFAAVAGRHSKLHVVTRNHVRWQIGILSGLTFSLAPGHLELFQIERQTCWTSAPTWPSSPALLTCELLAAALRQRRAVQWHGLFFEMRCCVRGARIRYLHFTNLTRALLMQAEAEAGRHKPGAAGAGDEKEGEGKGDAGRGQGAGGAASL